MPSYHIPKQNEVNKSLPNIMHIDMDSFFATCEQQENPLLRDKALGVVPNISKGSTIVAASIEAKKYGVKTGTKVKEALKLCPDITFREADPDKYRYIHSKLMTVLKKFTPNVTSKSIDEAVLGFAQTRINTKEYANKRENYPCESAIIRENPKLDTQHHKELMKETANNIKDRIKMEVGEYLNCSIGVGTNRFIAKVASNINKPDGFYYVNYKNIKTFYDIMDLTDLHGVGNKTALRLNKRGIYTPLDFFNASLQNLQAEFNSFGTYWFIRLRGFEIDDVETKRKTVGHSYHLPKFSNNKDYLEAIILKLTEKTTYRLRRFNLKARCFNVHCRYVNHTNWQKSHRKKIYLNDTKNIYKEFKKLFNSRKNKNSKIKIIGVSTSKFAGEKGSSLDLFGEEKNNNNLYNTIDIINNRFGSFTIMPASLLKYKEAAPDRIAFGNKD